MKGPEPTACDIELVVRRTFGHPAEDVFDAWLDPVTVGRWLFKTPGGAMERVALEPRVGGRFWIVERRGDVLAQHWGQYVAIERPTLLEFTFGYGSEEPSLVRIEFTPTETGCELILTQRMDAKWAEWTVRVREGWAMILSGLDRTLGHP